MNNTVENNPQHVENLNSIAKLEKSGFEGTDVDISTALFEYGLAWQEIGNEILFVYGIGVNDNGEYIQFDRCSFSKNIDVESEFDWGEFEEVMQFVGTTLEEWRKYPLSHKVSDLLSYYGFENVFGSSYWEGFQIEE